MESSDSGVWSRAYWPSTRYPQTLEANIEKLELDLPGGVAKSTQHPHHLLNKLMSTTCILIIDAIMQVNLAARLYLAPL